MLGLEMLEALANNEPTNLEGSVFSILDPEAADRETARELRGIPTVLGSCFLDDLCTDLSAARFGDVSHE